MDLLLYGARLSPFVRKVEVALIEKGLEFESENIGVPAPDWFAEVNPARRIPALRDRDIAAEGADGVIPDSSAICAFLERAKPDPALYPKAAYDYGRALWYEEYADSELAGCIGMGIFRPIVFPQFAKKDPDVETARKTVSERLPRFFDYLEGEIAGREFFVADAFSIADLSVATQLINLELAIGFPGGGKWPGLEAHLERVKQRPSLASSLAFGGKILKQPVDLGL